MEKKLLIFYFQRNFWFVPFFMHHLLSLVEITEWPTLDLRFCVLALFSFYTTPLAGIHQNNDIIGQNNGMIYVTFTLLCSCAFLLLYHYIDNILAPNQTWWHGDQRVTKWLITVARRYKIHEIGVSTFFQIKWIFLLWWTLIWLLCSLHRI